MEEHLGNQFAKKRLSWRYGTIINYNKKISHSFRHNSFPQKRVMLKLSSCIPFDTQKWEVKALGGCHASVHIHPEGRFEEAGEVWWWWHQEGTPCLVCFMSGLPPGGCWHMCLSQNSAVSDGRPPVDCRYPDRTNHTKLSLSHLDLAGCLWQKMSG